MKKTNLAKLVLIFSAAVKLFAQTAANNSQSDGVLFSFKQNEGESSSYISTVEEEAYFNNVLNNHAEIINRISSTIRKTNSDGSAVIDTNYMTTNNTLLNGRDKHLVWGEESNVTVTRKKTGELVIDDNAFMPTVRNVPVFPNKKVKIGDTWTADGKEVHDLRQLFNMKTPLIIPFTATYKYVGEVVQNGTKFNQIELYYEFYQQNSQTNMRAGSLYAATVGYSSQVLYWDSEKGILDHYNEEFAIKIQDVYGNIYYFKGTAHSEITEFKSLNNDENLNLIQDTINTLNLENISVKKGEKGLTISIENIQFEPDSAILLESEKIKLKKLSLILKLFPNDLLITGHCADRGTASARQVLSEDRAKAVAGYLEQLNVRDEKHVFTQGKGSTEPIATNNTEEGRSKNRRVEITLMD